MASPYRYEDRILQSATHHFAAHGFYNARIEAIADDAQLNKRMVYEYCKTKEALYMNVLSKVSRDTLAAFKARFSTLHPNDLRENIRDIIDFFLTQEAFVRLWVWEKMDGTIHGPRILEAASEIYAKLREAAPNASTDEFDRLLPFCQGLIATLAFNLNQDSPESLAISHGNVPLEIQTGLRDMIFDAFCEIIRMHPGNPTGVP